MVVAAAAGTGEEEIDTGRGAGKRADLVRMGAAPAWSPGAWALPACAAQAAFALLCVCVCVCGTWVSAQLRVA